MEEKLTIGLFIDTFYPMIDGVITVVDNYARELSKRAKVIVFAPDFSGEKFDDSIFPYKVVRCKSVKAPVIDYSLPIPRIDIEFKRELKKYKLDIVHIHSPFMLGRIGIEYAQKNKIPVVATMHSQFKQDFKRAIKSDLMASIMCNFTISAFNKCDECWAVNNEVGRIFHDDYGYKKVPLTMGNATEMKSVTDVRNARDTVNKLYKIDDDEKVFLFVGRINALKNIFFIVDAIEKLKEKKPSFKFKMLFVGKGQDEEKLKETIEQKKLQDCIMMCGRIEDKELLAKCYCRAELFLFPSLYDASSIVQIEAAAQKTPTLFLEGAATADTVKDNIDGFISPKDPEKYANKIIEIMENEEAYNTICDNAYSDLYINWEMVIDKVYDEYLKIIEEYKGENKN